MAGPSGTGYREVGGRTQKVKTPSVLNPLLEPQHFRKVVQQQSRRCEEQHRQCNLSNHEGWEEAARDALRRARFPSGPLSATRPPRIERRSRSAQQAGQQRQKQREEQRADIESRMGERESCGQ